MNRFLLLALTAGLLSPIAANAETYWLIFRGERTNSGPNSWQVPTSSKQECETALERALNKKNWSGGFESTSTGGICLKGK